MTFVPSKFALSYTVFFGSWSGGARNKKVFRLSALAVLTVDHRLNKKSAKMKNS